jgi:hypothetical protein
LETQEELVLLEERSAGLLIDLKLMGLDDVLDTISIVVASTLFN